MSVATIQITNPAHCISALQQAPCNTRSTSDAPTFYRNSEEIKKLPKDISVGSYCFFTFIMFNYLYYIHLEFSNHSKMDNQ